VKKQEQLKQVEEVCQYFYKHTGTVPTGCPLCQPDGEEVFGYMVILLEEPKPCPNCGRLGTRFYAEDG